MVDFGRGTGLGKTSDARKTSHQKDWSSSKVVSHETGKFLVYSPMSGKKHFQKQFAIATTILSVKRTKWVVLIPFFTRCPKKAPANHPERYNAQ
jgi:hypothetical protein